jgi:hypothetical protein
MLRGPGLTTRRKGVCLHPVLVQSGDHILISEERFNVSEPLPVVEEPLRTPLTGSDNMTGSDKIEVSGRFFFADREKFFL